MLIKVLDHTQQEREQNRINIELVNRSESLFPRWQAYICKGITRLHTCPDIHTSRAKAIVQAYIMIEQEYGADTARHATSLFRSDFPQLLS